MRRQRAGNIRLRRRGRRAQDQLRALHGFRNVVGDERKHRVMMPTEILDDDAAPGVAMRRDGVTIAPPQPHVVAAQSEVAGRCERAVASPENRDAHGYARPASRSFSMKCCTLPRTLRGNASTKTISRGNL